MVVFTSVRTLFLIPCVIIESFLRRGRLRVSDFLILSSARA